MSARSARSTRPTRPTSVLHRRTTTRACLRCGRRFKSEGAHNRLCAICRGRSVSPFEPEG